VVCDLESLEVVEHVDARCPARFPYVPGLLSFREAPVLLKAFGRLRHRPHAVLCDGQGLAHPRRIGLACHLGLFLDLPTIGVAKSRLIGEAAAPGLKRGASTLLRHDGEVIGRPSRHPAGRRPPRFALRWRLPSSRTDPTCRQTSARVGSAGSRSALDRCARIGRCEKRN
jgi:deoxyribonuclease V